MDLVHDLLRVYVALVILNAVFSAVCFYYYRDRLYQYSLYLWLGTVFTGALQGVLQETPLQMSYSFAASFGCSWVMVELLAFGAQAKFPKRAYFFLMAFSMAASGVLSRYTASFPVIAFPVALGVSFPLFHSSLRTLFRLKPRQANRGATKIYCGLLLVNGLHWMDYPFLRQDPRFVVFGFSLALGLLMAFSIYLPSFIIKDISERYANSVASLNAKLVDYQNQIAELLSLAQVGEMSFSFVHDMASPTTLLMYYSKEISNLHSQGVPSRDKWVSYSKGIEQATTRLVGLQNLFRALIKNENSAELVELDLGDTVSKCLDLFRPFLKERKITLTEHVPGTSSKIVAPVGSVERILLNLVQNAINVLLDRDQRRIDVRLNSYEEHFLLEIQDSGPGIPKERLESLWERFGHSETAKQTAQKAGRAGGSGFGLYKVKQIVESLDGKIDVESSSQGACFKISFPKRPAQALRSAA